MSGVRVPRSLMQSDAEELAARAGLEFLTDDEPGITRQRKGTGFTYIDQDGETVGGADREWLSSLAIPPAWTDVWLTPLKNSHLLATGRDDDGRKQYRYNPEFSELTDRLKYARLAYFGRALRRIRPHVEAALSSERVGTEEFALASATRLIDQGHLRVGNDVYRRTSGAHGATTLTNNAVDIVDSSEDGLELRFVGKGGKERVVEVEDELLRDALDALLDLPNEALFSYDSGGGTQAITSTALNTYIATIIGPAFSAKDFRTWGGTVAATEALVAGESELTALDAAAEALGNTRSVARSSYVSPAITQAAEDGSLATTWKASRSGKYLRRSESCVEKVLRAWEPFDV